MVIINKFKDVKVNEKKKILIISAETQHLPHTLFMEK